MSYKVVRDANGIVLAAGPDDDGFIPVIPLGATQSVENEMPAPPQAEIAQAEIERLEQVQIKRSARMEREEKLKEAEDYALATLGLNPVQLYAAASLPDAPTAFRTYKAMKDIDNQIVALREQLS